MYYEHMQPFASPMLLQIILMSPLMNFISFFHFFLFSTASNSCCPCAHGCGAIPWSVGDLPVTKPPKKTDYFFSSCHKLPMVP